jgi:DNA-binding LacI/PurR family transcriptional regulator
MINKKKNVSLRDIAKIAQADVGTVSRALSNSEGVGTKRAAEIKEIAKSMGYRPKPFRRKRTNTIGLIVRSWNEASRNIDAGYMERILSYVELEAATRGRHIHLHAMRFEDLKWPAFLQENRVDGVLIFGHTPSEFYQRFKDENIPIVAHTGEMVEKTGVDSVVCDPYPGISTAIEKLVSMNHRKIGIILPNLKFLTAGRKYDAYVDSLKKSDIDLIDKFALTGLPLGFNGGQQGAKQIIDLEEQPTAMLFNDDLTAIGAIYEFARNGIYVPEDISIVKGEDHCSYLFNKNKNDQYPIVNMINEFVSE